MARFNKKIAKDICDLISTDSYTVAEICEMVNIHKSTFYDWYNKKTDFSDAVKKARGEFDELMVEEAKKSLMKLVKGYTVQENRTATADTGKKDDDGKPIVRVKEHVVTEKHFQPNTAAVIFTLTNRDPANWKNRMNSEVSADVSIKSELENMTDEELQKIIDDDE